MVRYTPADPREWLNQAFSDLRLASTEPEGVYLEDLCFHTQQAAEKAIKALLIRRGVQFPYVHDLSQLLTLVERSGLPIPGNVRQAERLTRYAVIARYPGLEPGVNRSEYEEALMQSTAVLRWVEANL
jgi:HEPN domain-containing protein